MSRFERKDDYYKGDYHKIFLIYKETILNEFK